MKIPITQNTPEWLQWRMSGVGASDANVIMGVCPYKTPRVLAEEKIGLRQPEPAGFAAALGHKFEPDVRFCIGVETGIAFGADVCEQHDTFDHVRASYDGHSDEHQTFAEFKYVGRDKFDHVFKTGRPLDQHWPQLQQQFLVSGFSTGYYVVYTLTAGRDQVERFHSVEVKRDDEYIAGMMMAIDRFWADVKAGRLPDHGPGDPFEISDAHAVTSAARYTEIKRLIGELEAEKKSIEAELFLASDAPNVRIGPLDIQTVTRKGNVNYKNIPELKSVDLDQYRTKDTVYRFIRVRE